MESLGSPWFYAVSPQLVRSNYIRQAIFKAVCGLKAAAKNNEKLIFQNSGKGKAEA